MTRLPHVPRHLVGILWFSLLLVGCISQMSLTSGTLTGVETQALPIVKPQINGTGTWTRTKDGSTAIGVNLSLSGSGAGLPFRIAKADLNGITSIQVGLTGADLPGTFRPTQGDASGIIAVTNGAVPSLTFPSIPGGTKRILTVQGRDAGSAPLPGALIKTVFDNNSSTGSFGVSFRTTPAAQVSEGLTSTTRNTMTTADLNAMADTITGATATPGQYTSCHPSRVRVADLITVLNLNGGQILPITTAAATYRDPGAKFTYSFALSQSPAAADMPQLFSSDPATEVLDLGVMAPTGTPGTYTTPQNTVTASIDSTQHVTVTFDTLPVGTWKTGAFLAGDAVTPNTNYYSFNTRAGQATVATVSAANASSGATLSPFTGNSFAAVEPKFAVGEIRWLKTNAASGRKVQNLASNLIATLGSMTAGDSTDFTVQVGNSTSPYTCATSASLATTVNVQLSGRAGTLEANRPRLQFPTGTTLTLDSTGDAIRNLRVSGAQLILNPGGTLEGLSVDGSRFNTGGGVGAAVMAFSGATCTIAGVHVYDARHMAATPLATDKMAGILIGGSAGGQVINCLVDDNAANSGATSLRFNANGGPGEVWGIMADTSAFASISSCSVVGLSRTTGSGVSAASKVTGIMAPAPNVLVQNCTVANVEATTDAMGIAIVSGTVAGCNVQNIPFPITGGKQVTGIRIGNGITTSAATAMNNVLQNLGESAPSTAGTNLTAIAAVAPMNQQARVAGNRIQNSGGATFVGISVAPAATQINTTLEVMDNQILNNTNLDGAGSSFLGIGNATSFSANLVTIKHNDISNNTGFNTVYGIWTNIPVAGTPHAIAGNRFNSNNLGSATSGASNQTFFMIEAQGGGTGNYAIRDNLVTNNRMFDNTGVSQTNQFYGIHTNAASKTVRNNVVSGNIFDGSSNDTHILTMISSLGTSNIHANRIFDNTPSAGLVASTGTTFKGIEGNAGLAGTIVERNIIAEPMLGKHANWEAINLPSAVSCTATYRHNSILVGDNLAAGILSPNSGLEVVINNAMQCLATTGGLRGFQRTAPNAGDVAGGNWFVGYTAAYFQVAETLSPSTLTTGTVFGTSDPTVNVGSHAMGLSTATNGFSSVVIGAQGTYGTVLPLDSPPLF